MVSLVMTGGIKWVTPINTNRSLKYKFPVHQDKKQMLQTKVSHKNNKGTMETSTDYSMRMIDTQRVIHTNAISNYSLVKKKNYLLMYLIILVENLNKRTCSIIPKNLSSNLVFRN